MTSEQAFQIIDELEKEVESKEEEKTFHLSTEVLGEDDRWEKRTDSTEKESITTKLFSLFESAVKKVKETDLDINFGQSVEFTHIFQYEVDDLEEISIQIANGNVSIHTWDENNIRIENDVKVYRVETVDLARKQFLDETLCEVNQSSFRYRSERKTMKINAELFIPKNLYQKLKIKLFNGSIRGEQLNVKDIEAKTVNGMISFNEVAGQEAEFETIHGQIKLKDVTVDQIEAETVHGMIDFVGKVTKVFLQSLNGNISATTTNECQTLHTKSVTGNINITLETYKQINAQLTSNVGAISYDIDGVDVLKQKNEVLQKEITFKRKSSIEDHLHLFANTKTGSIHVQQLEG
ncbi:DUF4097 domain-containing protein [Bacillus carboniphilus]|uniref:DUF4097 domain-containing protein n=1 Tax=Bacillus carboniphilus TaxID=86663 RepID=A0ABY9JPZ4_9BACI|nr:DUF4097 domain-containing protein [Bacillus carboniphilus]WLR41469.1 DUF4097 domain-containing protein [Bacillus carboniphilus]